MKLALVTTGILLSTNVFAANILDKDLEGYKQAAVLAIGAHTPAFVCTNAEKLTIWGKPATAQGSINLAKSADLFPGEQPLLRFYYEEESTSVVTTVTTTADYKNVISVQIALSKTETHQVNNGTLAAPNIVAVKTTSVKAVVDCR